MIQKAIYEVISGNDLDYDTAQAVMREMMDGTATQAQMGALLAAMRVKGESIDEITACAAVMREKAVHLTPKYDVMDIVGTGGDEAGTFNISTTAAFVVAAGGVPVAKHGNRGVSSKSGAADLLEKLGAKLTLSADQSQRILDTCGICFLFAPAYHASMKYAAPVRKEMGVRTLFNILGPLSNPAGATMQLLGVYDEKLVSPLARVLSNLGVTRGLVVCGSDGLDEVTLTGPTHVCEIRFGKLRGYMLAPEQVGLARCTLDALAGGTPEDNARITRAVLSGARGPKRDVVIINAALSLYLGLDDCTVGDCVRLAGELIDSGKALKKLEAFIQATNEVAQ